MKIAAGFRQLSLHKRGGRRFGFIFAAFAFSNPCAADWRDPLEPLNRKVQAFNGWFTQVIGGAVPDDAADAIGPLGEATNNALVNLSEPLTFANAILQGRECAAGVTLRRFLVNSTIGLGGLFDVAKSGGGLAHYETDFSTTLGLWGVPLGPYIVLPIVGPSSARDVAAFAIEYAADPADYAIARLAGQASVIGREGLDAVRSASNGGKTSDSETGGDTGDVYIREQRLYTMAAARALEGYECPSALRNSFWQR